MRTIQIEIVLKEDEEIGWELLKRLMPNATRNSYPTYKPKWNDLIEEDIQVTNKEVNEQYKNYIEIAKKGNLKRCKNNYIEKEKAYIYKKPTPIKLVKVDYKKSKIKSFYE